MKNLISINNLMTSEILEITRIADAFSKNKQKSLVKDKNLCLMFFENSTRTRFSFEMAAHNLGLRIFHFDNTTTSITKGESLYDTIENLYAIGIRACVIRSTNKLIEDLIKSDTKMRFINAGEGNFSHPTQALLDFYTIKQYFDDLSDRKIVIVGDIKHSRVAKSNIELLNRFGARIYCVSPDYFKDEEIKNVIWSDDLNSNLADAHIVMGLRIQRERIEENISFDDYIKNFQINENNINKNSLLLHPGPVNRDVEISSNLLNSNQGKTILKQAHNGVYIRMAVLNMILGDKNVENC